MNFVKGKIVSDTYQTEIPCLECNCLYNANHITPLDGDDYTVLTCPSCGDWDFHDRYVKRRLLVQEAVNGRLCEWRNCKVTDLPYMVRVSVSSAPVWTFWDEIIEGLEKSRENRDGLVAVYLKLCSWLGVLDEEYDNIPLMSNDDIIDEIEGWIDTYRDDKDGE